MRPRPFRGLGGYMPNRTLCDVLQAIRDCHKTRNYSYLPGLVEEAQMLGNRMEASLWDQRDFKHAEKRYKKLKEKIKEMEDKLDDA